MSKLTELIEKIKANIVPAAPVAPVAPLAKYEVGKPAPDLKEGENPQPDGSVIVVEGGMVKEIKPSEKEMMPTMAQVQSLENNVTAMAEQLANLSEIVKAKFESEKKIEQSIIEMKNQIQAKHVPAKKSVDAEPVKQSPAEIYLKRQNN